MEPFMLQISYLKDTVNIPKAAIALCSILRVKQVKPTHVETQSCLVHSQPARPLKLKTLP